MISLPVEEDWFGISVSDDGDFMVMYQKAFIRYDKEGNEKLRVDAGGTREFPVRVSGAVWRRGEPLWLSQQLGSSDPLVLRATNAIAIPGKNRMLVWNQELSPWIHGGLFLH